MKLLIVDVEATGLDPKKDSLIEVGAILFDVDHNAVIANYSFLKPCRENPVEHINKIPATLTQSCSFDSDACLGMLMAMLANADYVVAHNASFDKQWMPFPAETKWLCTMQDFKWPESMGLKGRFSLAALALAHGVPVWAQHRALTDCIYIAQVFEKSYQLETMVKMATEPKVLCVSGLGFAQKEKVKEAGFTWNDPVERAWSKLLTNKEFEKMKEEFRLRVHRG